MWWSVGGNDQRGDQCGDNGYSMVISVMVTECGDECGGSGQCGSLC